MNIPAMFSRIGCMFICLYITISMPSLIAILCHSVVMQPPAYHPPLPWIYNIQCLSETSVSTYHQIFDISRTESQNLNVSHVLQMSLWSILKPCVKSRIQMSLEQRRLFLFEFWFMFCRCIWTAFQCENLTRKYQSYLLRSITQPTGLCITTILLSDNHMCVTQYISLVTVRISSHSRSRGKNAEDNEAIMVPFIWKLSYRYAAKQFQNITYIVESHKCGMFLFSPLCLMSWNILAQ